MSCAVKTCKNYKSRRPDGVSFYRFPTKNEEMMKKWIEILRLGSEWSWSANKFVCSKHFQEKDFSAHHGERGRRGLKPSAVPSLYLEGNADLPETCRFLFAVNPNKSDTSDVLEEKWSLKEGREVLLNKVTSSDQDSSNENIDSPERLDLKRRLSSKAIQVPESSELSIDSGTKRQRVIQRVKLIHNYASTNQNTSSTSVDTPELTDMKGNLSTIGTPILESSEVNPDSGTKRQRVIQRVKFIHDYAISPSAHVSLLKKKNEFLRKRQKEYHQKLYSANKKIETLQKNVASLNLVVDYLKEENYLCQYALEQLEEKLQQCIEIPNGKIS